MNVPVVNERPTLPVADGCRMTSRRDDGVIQMIEQIDEKHAEAHRRLRQDLDRLEEQVNRGFESLREGRQSNSSRIEKLETAPIDATKLVLNSKVVVSLVVIALGIAAAVWGLRSAITDLASKMDTTYKLQELQNVATKAATDDVKASINDMKRRQELQQYEIQGLKDMVKDAIAAKVAKEKLP
jgi:hypothetical protein